MIISVIYLCSSKVSYEGRLRELGLFSLEKRREEVSGETSLRPSSTWRERINRRGNGCLRGWIVIGQGGMVLNWDRGGLGWILGGSFSPRGWWRTGTGCPRRLWMPHPWRLFWRKSNIWDIHCSVQGIQFSAKMYAAITVSWNQDNLCQKFIPHHLI